MVSPESVAGSVPAGTFAGRWGLAIYLQLLNCCKKPWKK